MHGHVQTAPSREEMLESRAHAAKLGLSRGLMHHDEPILDTPVQRLSDQQPACEEADERPG